MAPQQHGYVHIHAVFFISIPTLIASGIYEPFDVVTGHALEHALSEHGLRYDEHKVVQIMAAYNRLHECVIAC